MENQKNNVPVAAQEKPVAILKRMLSASSVQEQFRNALHDNKDAFIASLIDLYTGDKSLQQCAPALIVSEALRAATMHLPINKSLGFAYIVVYNNSKKLPNGQWQKVPTPTFIPGYKGYIQLAMRTGQYRTINADLVYEGELRKVDKLSGTIQFDGEKLSGKVVGYFAYFELINGFSKTLYMSVEDMASHAKRYSKGLPHDITADKLAELANKPQAAGKVGWLGNFNDMAIKTTLRRLLSKYGYLSIEMQKAIIGETEAEQAESAYAEEVRDDIEENANSGEAVGMDGMLQDGTAGTGTESSGEEGPDF